MSRLRTVITASALAVAITFTTAAVQAQETRGESARMRFDIAPGPLPGALRQFSERTGIQFVYSTPIANGVQSPGVAGDLVPSEALSRLLVGTDLIYRFTAPKTVTFDKAPNIKDSRVLGPVRVEGSDSARIAAVNGSTDPTATEGTKSYTSGALSIASKTPQSIKDTAQSVSVITQQRMRDQNATDFGSMMNQATGVSVVGDPLNAVYYSRGFAIKRLQVDGGAPLDIYTGRFSDDVGLVTQIDMAMYDHAEVLRGADGLFNGYGEPGGVINLTRKRPLDHSQVIVEGQAGSWNNYRTVIDATAPLGFDGKLRGRGVLTYQDQDYFYDTASSNKTLAYGILEYDLTSSTTLSAGFSSSRQDTVPFYSGLPRYQSGADLKLPRDTCFCFAWNRYDVDADEVFTRLEQSLGPDWRLRLNLTHVKQDWSYKYGAASGPVNPLTLTGTTMRATMGDRASEQRAADWVLDGSFELFGHRQSLVLGANYTQVDGAGYTMFTGVGSNPALNVFNFSANDPRYAEPASGRPSSGFRELGTTQWGAYTTLGLTFWEPLHLNLGLRYSHNETSRIALPFCSDLAGCTDINGNRVAVGELLAHNPRFAYSTHDLSWPPTWSLVYELSDTLSIYGSYSDIYKDQSTRVDHSGNPVGPITGGNIEGGVKWSARDGRLNAALAIYRLEQDNFSVLLDYGPYEATRGALPDRMHNCCYSNDLDQTYLSEGADLEVTGEVLPGWQLALGYTYNKNEYQGSATTTKRGQPLISLAPEHLVKLWSSYQFQSGEWLRRLNVGAGVNAQSESYISGSVCIRYLTNAAGNVVCDTANGGSVPFEFTQGFYAVFSVRVAYQLDARWSAALNINNLGDRTYYQTVSSSAGGNYYGEPRNFTLSLRGSF